MADRSSPSESFHDYDVVVDDLSDAWEFINPSSTDDDDAEDLDNFSFTEEEGEHDPNHEASSGLLNKEEGLLEFGSPSSDISMDPLSAQLHNHPFCDDVDDNNNKKDDEYDNEDDENEDYDAGYELDDELVPWGLSDKFGRQRIRKLGKRACPRMNKSKRLGYRYNRPGCVHGKHGFGVQHTYI